MSKLNDMKTTRDFNFKSIGQCVVNIKYNQDKLDRLLIMQQELMRKIQRLERNEESEEE